MTWHHAGQRYLVVHIPDWQTASLTLAVPPGSSAAVISRGRVLHPSLAARKDGVQVGMKVSSAQILSPNIVLISQDLHSDAVRFEAVIRAIETQVACVYAIRPGLAWALVGGAARWHGGETAVAEAIIDAVSEYVGLECQVGIATGVLTAIVAAHRGDIVPPQDSARYLGPVPLSRVLSFVPEWESLLTAVVRELAVLGIHTCAQLVDADRVQYQARFGPVFHRLYDLAAGGDVFLPRSQQHEYDIRAHYDCQEAQISSDHLMIPMTRLARELTQKMANARVKGRRMITLIGSGNGKKYRREWGGISADKADLIVRRLRWHLQSLLSEGKQQHECGELTGGVAFLEVRVRECEQADPNTPLWGARKDNEGVERCVERIHALLGTEAVLSLHSVGAYDPRSSVRALPWGQYPETAPAREAEWAGAVSEPPEVLCRPPIPVALTVCESRACGQQVELERRNNGGMCVGRASSEEAQIITFPGMSAEGERENSQTERSSVFLEIESRPVLISPRGTLNAAIAHVELLRAPHIDALAHWKIECRYQVEFIEPVWNIRGHWWTDEEEQAHRRRSYVRGRGEDGTELLFVSYGKQWWIEGVYDRVNY